MKSNEEMLQFAAAVTVLCVIVQCGAGCSGPVVANLDYNVENARAIRQEFEIGGAVAGAESSPLDDPNRTPQWGMLTGTFRVDDTRKIPPAVPLNITKDQAVCAPGGKSVLSQFVEIGANNGIKNLLLFLNTPLPANDADQAEPVWVHKSYSYAANPELKEVIFDQRDCVFLSHVAAVRSDQMVKILNSDPVLHNTKLEPKNAVKLNESIVANGFTIYEPKRQEESPFSVSCSVHPWMSAWMISRDNPYFAVTGDDGSFQIANIPAGVDLEFRIWQEKTGFLNETVKLDGQDLSLKKGRFALPRLAPDETRTLQFVVDGAAFQ